MVLHIKSRKCCCGCRIWLARGAIFGSLDSKALCPLQVPCTYSIYIHTYPGGHSSFKAPPKISQTRGPSESSFGSPDSHPFKMVSSASHFWILVSLYEAEAPAHTCPFLSVVSSISFGHPLCQAPSPWNTKPCQSPSLLPSMDMGHTIEISFGILPSKRPDAE